MIELSEDEWRRAFPMWLRTGRLPSIQKDDAIECKFNPWHDPRNGQFTFAPNGPHSLGHVIIAPRRQVTSAQGKLARAARLSAGVEISRSSDQRRPIEQTASMSDAVYRPDEADSTVLRPTQFFRPPRERIGSNSRAFEDPMLLEQVFPGLRDAPGGAIVALADNIFDFTGPSRAAMADFISARTNVLIAQIRTVDPNFRF